MQSGNSPSSQRSSIAAIAAFLKLESAGGIILIATSLAAMICANSFLAPWYQLLLDTPVEVRIGALEISKPLLLWINDGLMSIFFFLIGLELKRELLEGELSDPRNIILPGIGAVGGMLVPALIYIGFNSGDAIALEGWAIPAATDIAFALAILAILGPRVPTSLKIFLTSLAIFDDIGAIAIIAVFYTDGISIFALAMAAICFPVLFMLNRGNVLSYSPYMLIGAVLWVALMKSGVHATLAGILVATFIPIRSKSDPEFSPLMNLEHDLHPVVAFLVLPVFAFVNAGIDLRGVSLEQLTHGVPMGIGVGLFFGKQIGIFGLCWLAIKTKLTTLPAGMTWSSLYGTAALCGIGFTMSLFIGSLAFEETGVNQLFDERLGIILGSIASGIVGYVLLRIALPAAPEQ